MVDHKQIAVDWAARGFSCELWVDPPGQPLLKMDTAAKPSDRKSRMKSVGPI